ncbi:hypothetical protein [Abyssalbus ytuae]|uniref:Uncharacterized protein n=1 Tax=Abyssalbus ytuae TaxID=2926907 RepID=A0A9E6ZZT9_9FLAO|nr:hypothetical protein [Abyssalbus ytuae]UOB18187.1 hypothetical protein MQE35_02545 [Abyssalbus ytuae]
MKNPLKTILLIVGVVLIAYGLYTVFAPDAVIDAGPLHVEASDNSIDTKSILIIGIGVLAFLGAMFYKKK